MTKVAMIFAAGRGTRMGALTAHRPKPLIKVAGRALIEHALDLVDGFDKIIVNTHYHAPQLQAYLSGRNVTISHESTLLETGGGLKHALPLIDADAVVTLNSDAVWTGENPIQAMLKAWDPKRMDALLTLIAPKDAIAHRGPGDFILSDDGTLTRGPGLTYGGCQIIKTDLVRDIDQDVFSLNLVWDQILKNGRAYGLRHHGRWCDVGHPAGIELAEEMLEGAIDV